MFPALKRIGPSGHIVGIEMEEDWAEWLQKRIAERSIPNAENLCMNACAMSFPDASFDAVIVGLVGLDDDYDLHRGEVINGAPLMSEAFRVLGPGRKIHVSGWLVEEDNDWMGELVRRHLPGCNKRGYFPMTADELSEILEFVGFEDIQAARFKGEYTFESPGEWMAGIGHIWEEELATIQADPSLCAAFERDALDLLRKNTKPDGTIPYTRVVLLISARKPLTPSQP